MKSVMTWVLMVGILIALVPDADAQRRRNNPRTGGGTDTPPKPVSAGDIQIPWANSYRGALEEAAARNAPILVFYLQDGEEGNERVVSKVLANKSMTELSDRVICMIASTADHGEVEVETEDGAKKMVCKRYGHLSKSERRRAEMEVRMKFFQTNPIKTPLYQLINPKGEEIWAKEVDIDIGDSAGELVSVVMNDLKALGPSLSREEFWRAQRLLEESEDLMAQGEYAELILALEPYAKDSRKLGAVKQLQDLIVQVDKAALGAVEKAEAMIADRRVIDGILDLEELAEAFDGLETGDAAEEALKKHEKTDAVKAFRSELKDERKAIKLLESADELADRGRLASALKKYKQIVEKHETTRAGREAAERIRDLEG
ncbi:MAG: hypothetical protein RL885_03160 [Planctomycetota bacterium]